MPATAPFFEESPAHLSGIFPAKKAQKKSRPKAALL
jgi:hypothetical protein